MASDIPTGSQNSGAVQGHRRRGGTGPGRLSICRHSRNPCVHFLLRGGVCVCGGGTVAGPPALQPQQTVRAAPKRY